MKLKKSSSSWDELLSLEGATLRGLFFSEEQILSFEMINNAGTFLVSGIRFVVPDTVVPPFAMINV
jgi:hypothetical protein